MDAARLELCITDGGLLLKLLFANGDGFPVETERGVRGGGKFLRYGEGVVAVRGLKLWPMAVSLRFVEPFHRGRSTRESARDSARDALRGVGVEYRRDDTPVEGRSSETLDRVSGVFLGMLLWLP